jgi:integrase/predicted RNase H-like HicB family nuclease
MSKTRTNGEGSIRERADGRFEVRISGDYDFKKGDYQRISRYTKTQEEAVALLHTLSHNMNLFPQQNNTSMKLGDWLELWLTIYMKNTLKQSTYIGYEGYIRNHFKPAIGNTELRELTPRFLQMFYNYKIEQGLSPKTIINMNLCLHKALDQAMKEGLLSSNPASAINLSRGQKPQIEILTRDEQFTLLRASYSHHYGVFIRLVLATGLRLGELLGLRWEDIDFRSNMLQVNRTLNRLTIPNLPENHVGPRTEIVIQPPKSKNALRSLPLLPPVMQDLLAWRAVQEQESIAAGPAYCGSGFIVTNALGGYVEPRTFKDYYDQVLDLAGLRHFTFHALRHTFASRAMEQGMDSKTLSILLGHYSVSFTLDTYAHVLNDQKWAGMKLMEELLTIDQTVPANLIYPLIITPGTDGTFLFTVPDFPQVQFIAPTLEYGLQSIGEVIREELNGMVYPPPATPVEIIIAQPGQMVVQVPV